MTSSLSRPSKSQKWWKLNSSKFGSSYASNLENFSFLQYILIKNCSLMSSPSFLEMIWQRSMCAGCYRANSEGGSSRQKNPIHETSEHLMFPFLLGSFMPANCQNSEMTKRIWSEWEDDKRTKIHSEAFPEVCFLIYVLRIETIFKKVELDSGLLCLWGLWVYIVFRRINFWMVEICTILHWLLLRHILGDAGKSDKAELLTQKWQQNGSSSSDNKLKKKELQLQS